MSENTPPLFETLRGKTSLELLHMRAEGEMLADEWHSVIEKVLVERGEDVPPLPTAPIFFERPKDRSNISPVLLVPAFLVFLVAGKMLAHTLVGAALGAAVILFYVGRFLFRSDTQAAAAQQRKLAKEDGLNELMRSSADGQIVRVTELLAYRAFDVNERTRSGATALFYAARNGHEDIAVALIKAGADKTTKNDKGLRAVDIAKQYGHDRLVPILTEG